jgi:hypothetical protein
MIGEGRARIAPALICVLSLTLALGTTHAWEVQLAGVRLGQHGVNLLDVYGEPNGVSSGDGADFGGAAAAEGEMGAVEGMEGMAAPGEEMAGMAPEAAGPGEFPAGEEAVAEEGAAVGAAAAGAVQRNPYPRWAMPVWFELAEHDVEWFYRIGPVVLGFVMDRDGYIKTIAIAAAECNFARTALWEPHGYVKLGDDYKRVIYRYGWPDLTYVYGAEGPGEAAEGAGTWDYDVSWASINRYASRDCVLRYENGNNIAFALHDMKVVRIYIWTHD